MGRLRHREVRIRMTDDEYERYQNRFVKAGLTANSFGIKCLLDHPVTTVEGWGDIAKQLRGIGTNVNQIAKFANMGSPIRIQLDELQEGIDTVWQLSRQLNIVRQDARKA